MVTRKRKTGRPIGFYRMTDGTRIDGLIKLKDGRWRISGPEKTTFTEADECRAVRRAQDIMSKRQGHGSKVFIQIGEYPDGHAAGKALVKTVANIGNTFVGRIPRHGGPVRLQKSFDTADVWQYVAETILNNPKYAAKRTGIECLAWLPDIKKPAPSPTLSEVGEFYTSRTDISEKESGKCRTTWAAFGRAVGVVTLREITPELVAGWGIAVKKKTLSAKSIHHAFNRVKTILNHYRQTGRCIDDVRHALDCCAVLKAPETTSIDPHPISRSDLHKLLASADDDFKTMLLVALNLALYPIDVARLKWSDFDMERSVYTCKRGKTKVARIGTYGNAPLMH